MYHRMVRIRKKRSGPRISARRPRSQLNSDEWCCDCFPAPLRRLRVAAKLSIFSKFSSCGFTIGRYCLRATFQTEESMLLEYLLIGVGFTGALTLRHIVRWIGHHFYTP